ncbi:DUF4402 domain-containing protein [Sphingomonas cavernae]|nr:DUF4402 domain-containing protein [Sphingomonas cavernae]
MKIQLAKAALCGSMLIAASFGANSAHAATANADAKARIITQVSVAKVAGQDLDFGAIVPGASSGTVTIASTGVRTCAAALTCSGTTSAAGFSISGASGETVLISSAPSVTLTGGAGSMTATLSPSISTLVLDGTDGFTVGGVLTVPSSVAAGSYSGQFNVTVNYQ